jgi:hypothetical protein
MNRKIIAIVIIALICSVPIIAANNSPRDWGEVHHSSELYCTDCHNLADPDWGDCNNCHGANDPYDDDDRGFNHRFGGSK